MKAFPMYEIVDRTTPFDSSDLTLARLVVANVFRNGVNGPPRDTRLRATTYIIMEQRVSWDDGPSSLSTRQTRKSGRVSVLR